mmetsp:Transcript_105292/g.339643  ORF Transcript_105292/g.339643 Transcript_105292/m.339643 type:complete len:115 (-) Transcript_105292:218-562(-)
MHHLMPSADELYATSAAVGCRQQHGSQCQRMLGPAPAAVERDAEGTCGSRVSAGRPAAVELQAHRSRCAGPAYRRAERLTRAQGKQRAPAGAPVFGPRSCRLLEHYVGSRRRAL